MDYNIFILIPLLKIISEKLFSFKARDIAILLNPDSKSIRIAGSGRIHV
jgi:hypothetical protein